MESGTRAPSAAGSFYPRKKEELLAFLEDAFSHRIQTPPDIRAVIVPHAGYIYSGYVAATGFSTLPINNNQHFVIIGPSHYVPFEGLVGSGKDRWETPLGRVTQKRANVPLSEEVRNPEHSIEVEIPFLQYLYGNQDFSITTVATGASLDGKTSAEQLLAAYPDSIFIISSDLSHYLPEDAARKKDKKTIEAILRLDNNYLEQEENVACGAMGIRILLHMAEKKGWKGNLIAYNTSASASGDRSRVVGYASIGFSQ